MGMIFPRLRVFVSSRMEELVAERRTIKEALNQLQVDAWVFEEDAGARSVSPRNTYLEELEAADLYIGVFWRSLGSHTLNEYDCARKSGKDCLIYEKRLDIEGARDPHLETFLNSIGRVESGHTIKRFQTADDLAVLVKQDVAAWLTRKVRERTAPNVVRQFVPPDAADLGGLEILLSRVKQFWVQGVLKQSVHTEVGLEVGRESQMDAVVRPWEGVLELPDQTSTISDLPVSDLFEQVGRSLLILGAPGSGKTITLLELASSMVDRAEQDSSQPVPVVFNLSSWDGGSLFSWLERELAVRYQIPKRAGSSWLRKGRLLLLLDGLDEVQAGRRGRCVKAINDFAENYGVPGIAVCSRHDEYEQLPNRLKLSAAVRLQPLEFRQVAGYLAKVGPSAAGLRTALEKDESLRSLATTPLMFDVLILAYHGMPVPDLSDPGDAPELTRTRVFAAYVDWMFRRRGRSTSPYAREQTLAWLSRLATGLRNHDETEFLIESLQPAWLDSSAHRWFFFLITRILTAWPVALALSWISIQFLLLVLPLSAAGVAVGIMDYRRLRRPERNMVNDGKALVWRVIRTGWTGMAGIVGLFGLPLILFPQHILMVPGILLLVTGALIDRIPGASQATWSWLLFAPVLWLVTVPMLVGLPFSLRSIINAQRGSGTAGQLGLSWRKFLIVVVAIALPSALLLQQIGYKPGEHVLLGNARDGSLTAVIPGHEDAYGAEFGPDGSRILTSGSSGFSLWDVPTRRLLNSFPKTSVPYFGADGNRLLTIDDSGANQQNCRLWDREGKPICQFECLRSETWFIEGGRRLLAYHSPEISILDSSNCSLVRTLPVGEGVLFLTLFIAISADGKHFAVRRTGEPAKLWNAEPGSFITGIEATESLDFSPDGTYMATCCPTKLWRTSDGSPVLAPGISDDGPWEQPPRELKPGSHIAFSKEGGRVAVLRLGRPIRIWDLSRARFVASLDTPGNAMFSPKGDVVVTYGVAGNDLEPGPIQVWNANDGRLMHSLETTPKTASVNISGDGKRVLEITPGGKYSVTFSAEGNRVAAARAIVTIDEHGWDGGPEQGFELWDSTSGAFVARLEGDKLSFSPDGARIGTAGKSGVRLWDSRDGTMLAAFSSWQKGTLQFSPVGDRLVAVVEPLYFREVFHVTLILAVIIGLVTGLRSSPSRSDPRANWGIWLLSRRALLSGILCGSVFVLAGSLSVRVPLRLLELFLCGALLGSWFTGGLDVLQHYLLRLLLFHEGQVPLNCARFLDDSATLTILRKVGSGYIFVHRLVLEYFADLSVPEPVAPPK